MTKAHNLMGLTNHLATELDPIYKELNVNPLVLAILRVDQISNYQPHFLDKYEHPLTPT